MASTRHIDALIELADRALDEDAQLRRRIAIERATHRVVKARARREAALAQVRALVATNEAEAETIERVERATRRRAAKLARIERFLEVRDVYDTTAGTNWGATVDPSELGDGFTIVAGS